MAGFTVSNGQIVGLDGNDVQFRGINIYADLLLQIGASPITALFPGINLLRVNVFDMNADNGAALAPVVNALTAKGVTVEIEDHNYPNVLTGGDLSAAEARYVDWANTFKSNPNVVFGTQNEPSDPSGTPQPREIDDEILGIYNAIRSTGNQTLVFMNGYGGFSNASWTQMDPSRYASVTNAAWDLHYYNWEANGATDVASNASALSAAASGLQGIRDANGVVPVFVGEYGTAAAQDVDAGGPAVVTAVEQSGLSSAEWAYTTGNPNLAGDLVTNGALTPLGHTVASFIAAGPTIAPPPPPTSSPSPVVTGTGSDSLVLSISEDAYQGDAQFTVSVDGKQLGGTFTALGSRAAGQHQLFTFNGDWAPGGHTVTANFLNDAYGGTPSTDRNLYVDKVTYDGVVTGQTLTEMSAGPQSFSVSDSTAIPGVALPSPIPGVTGAGSDTLVLSVSEDAYQGDAQFTVSVDGKQIGGTFTASASHAVGNSQAFTFKGDWAPGNHSVTVNFLNDAYGGTATTDRNLYVSGATYNGSATGASLSMFTGGPQSFQVSDNTALPNGSPPPVPTGPTDDFVLNIGDQVTVKLAHGDGGMDFLGGGSLDAMSSGQAVAYNFHPSSGLLTIEDFSVVKGDILNVDKSLQSSLVSSPDTTGGMMLSFGMGHSVDLKGVTALPAVHFV